MTGMLLGAKTGDFIRYFKKDGKTGRVSLNAQETASANIKKCP
jgi:hypothetical protein